MLKQHSVASMAHFDAFLSAVDDFFDTHEEDRASALPNFLDEGASEKEDDEDVPPDPEEAEVDEYRFAEQIATEFGAAVPEVDLYLQPPNTPTDDQAGEYEFVEPEEEKEEVQKEELEVKEEESDAGNPYLDDEGHFSEVSPNSEDGDEKADQGAWKDPGDRYVPKWFVNKPKPSKAKKRGGQKTCDEIAMLRDEEVAARALHVPWQKRGPAQPSYEGECWRGQRCRTGKGGGTVRWGNSGGEHRQWYSGYYRAKGKGKEAVKRYLERFGEPPSKKAGKSGGSSGSNK
jgi:hypothetical protein